MIEKIHVIDNVIPKKYQNYLETNILSRDFPWYFVPNITLATEGENQLSTDAIGLSHTFIDIETGSMSFATEKLTPLLIRCCEKIGVKPKGVYWGRVFMTISNGRVIRTLFHTDMDIPHLVCLYYINDSTGPTVMLSKTYEEFTPEEINAEDQSQFITHEIEPKKGRVVFFDGRHYHASTTPAQGRRCTINFDVQI